MRNIIDAFASLYSEQVWIEIDPDKLAKIGSVEGNYSNDAARWRAENNFLALDAVMTWLRDKSGIEETPQVWPGQNGLAAIWEFVNGTAIALGNTRLVLIPSDTLDADEFCVPAEWVDIPQWAADYYLAIQLNPERGWLRVWGYATHQQLKYESQYDRIMRTYSLAGEQLIEDLNAMWVAREFGSDRRVALEPTAILSSVQAETLWQQLVSPLAYSPRLTVEFCQWAAFIENPIWREELYRRRTHRALPKEICLSQWLDNIFEAGLSTVEALLGEPEPELKPAVTFRNQDPLDFRGAAKRAIDLGMRLAGHAVALAIAVKAESAQKINIRLRLYPMEKGATLPPGLTLSILDENAEVIELEGDRWEATAREADKADDWLEWQVFGAPGERFAIKIALGDASVIQNVVI